MKRDIRGTQNVRPAGSGAGAPEGAVIESLVQAYSGKSETELLTALSGMNGEERAGLSALSEELWPMLNEAQQKKLASIMAALRD